jgi:hypothetical protein
MNGKMVLKQTYKKMKWKNGENIEQRNKEQMNEERKYR